jgi:hypothetical protein
MEEGGKMEKVNLREKLGLFSDLWSPKCEITDPAGQFLS